MAERGAAPKVPAAPAEGAQAARYLFTPLLPDDYLELINPLWSTASCAAGSSGSSARPDAVTVVDPPGLRVAGAQARAVPARRGRGRRRLPLARVLAHLGARPRRRLISDHAEAGRGRQGLALPRRARPGRATIVRLGGVEGSFVLPDPMPDKVLFISAGSGITPIMSMLRDLDRRDECDDVVHVHSARTAERGHVRRAARRARRPQRRLSACTLRLTGEQGRHHAEGPGRAVPRLARARGVSLGPGDMLDAMTEHWEREGDCDRLHMERFQPKIGGDADERRGRARSRFAASDCEANATAAHRSSSPARRPALDLPVRLPDGNLPHLRRAALLRAGARPANREGVTARGRDGPHLHQRPRGRRRDRTMNDDERGRRREDDRDESPLAQLTRRADRRTREGVQRDPRRGVRRARRPRPALHQEHDLDAPAARA